MADQNCRYGSGCTRAKCHFVHPQTPSPKEFVAKPCRYGDKCTRDDCNFAHPGAASVKPCRYGDKCTRADCKFAHPVAASVKPCRYGDTCTRADCKFGHPAPDMFTEEEMDELDAAMVAAMCDAVLAEVDDAIDDCDSEPPSDAEIADAMDQFEVECNAPTDEEIGAALDGL